MTIVVERECLLAVFVQTGAYVVLKTLAHQNSQGTPLKNKAC